MSLHTVTTGGTINAVDVNQLVNVLQQPSGGTESGKYFLTFNASASGQFGSYYYASLSRGATPVSVTIDTADQAPAGGAGSPATGNLTANGFQITSQSSASGGNERCGGNLTINF